MVNKCVSCCKTIPSGRHYITCGFCKKIAHRVCTDITCNEYNRVQRESATFDWHCQGCWHRIQHNGEQCPCEYCNKRRMDGISFEIPDYERSDFTMISSDMSSARNNTVSSMDATQILSPVRYPDDTVQPSQQRPGMYASSWTTDQLAPMLNSVPSVDITDQSGPSWVQPDNTEATINNTSVEIRCCREPIVCATPPRVNFIVTTGGAKKGGIIITANPYGWKYYQDHSNKTKYFRCSVTGCKGRLIIPNISDTASFIMKGHHICAPNISSQNNIELSKKVKALAKENPYTNGSDLANQAMRDVVPSSPSQPLTGLTSVQNLCKQGNRARQHVRDPIPKDMNDLLTMQLCKEQFPDSFFRWDIKVSNENEIRRHVFFATEKQMTYLAMATNGE